MERHWLRQIREGKGYTQHQVGKFSGTSRHYISMIELGIRRPSVEVAKRIASVLGFDWTLFFEEPRHSSKIKKAKREG